jgi:D-apionate oxidoisomerase
MKVTLIGAGGKMGCRITDNLWDSAYDMSYIEISPQGLENLRVRGVAVSDPMEVLPEADIVILGVPDVAIEAVTREYVPLVKPGSVMLALDPAAPLDGKVFHRDDIHYVIAHPCHPSIFNWEPDENLFRDFYGGVTAKQAMVIALMHGDEAAYHRAEQVSIDMYAPVNKVHRITLEQMAMLEPALVETLAQTCMEVIREGYDRVVEKGVPADAVRDFLLGHLRIQIAVLFKEVNGTFSDAAYKISKRAKPILFKENWQQIFELDDIKEQVRDITNR